MKGLAAGVLAFLLLAADTPMDDAEVVRRLVARDPVEDILRDIESRPPAFDLSDEMVEEMRRAGVPEVLIAAMRRRTREAARKAAAEIPPSGAPAAAPRGPHAESRRAVYAASGANLALTSPTTIARAHLIPVGVVPEGAAPETIARNPM